MLGLTRLEGALAGAVLLLLALVGYGLYERHAGYGKCVRQDEAAVERHEVSDAAVNQRIHNDYTLSVSAPVLAPVVVRLRIAPDPVPAATPARGADGEAPLSGLDNEEAVREVSFSDVQADGRDADATISALQSYILQECRARG